MHVSELYLYPVKACAGISVQDATLVRRGFARDRRFMIVDDKDGHFVSQRQVASLALVHTALDGEDIVLGAKGMPDLRLPFTHAGETRRVQIWRDNVPAETHPAGSEWFTRYLERAVSLVYMPDSTERQVDLTFAKQGDVVSFADGYPLLVITEASLTDLNRRLASPIPMNRFRPSIVIAGAEPYAEETWAAFTIGTLRLRGVKPCKRCNVTTIDQATSVAGIEPLRTLATYKRAADGKVIFGMNVLHDDLGAIRVGDPLHAVRELRSS